MCGGDHCSMILYVGPFHEGPIMWSGHHPTIICVCGERFINSLGFSFVFEYPCKSIATYVNHLTDKTSLMLL